jgi:hypothetical protein
MTPNTSLTHGVVIPGTKQKQISAVATVPGRGGGVGVGERRPNRGTGFRRPNLHRRQQCADRYRLGRQGDPGQAKSRWPTFGFDPI